LAPGIGALSAYCSFSLLKKKKKGKGGRREGKVPLALMSYSSLRPSWPLFVGHGVRKKGKKKKEKKKKGRREKEVAPDLTPQNSEP